MNQSSITMKQAYFYSKISKKTKTKSQLYRSDLKLDCKFLLDPLCQKTEVYFTTSDPRSGNENQLWIAAKPIPNKQQGRQHSQQYQKMKLAEKQHHCYHSLTHIVILTAVFHIAPYYLPHFLDWGLIPYHYSSCCCSCSCWGDCIQKKPKAPSSKIGSG